MPALVAAEAREAACEDAARKKLAELPLDEGGQALTSAAGSRLLEEGLEVLAEHAMQHAVLGPPAEVGARAALAVAVGPPPGRVRTLFHAAQS
jgi:hypothetical protein